MARKKPSVLTKILPELLLGFGVLFVLVSTSHRLLRSRSLALSEAIVTQYLQEPSVTVASPNYPTHLTIPWFVDVDIDPQVFVSGKWSVSQNHASYLVSSALPGNPGNIILYGHNKRTIMGNIRVLKGYEKITLTLADGSTRTYQIESMKQVSPTQTDLLSPTDTETLTLYTCSGFMDSQRFVVRAKPIPQPDFQEPIPDVVF